MVHYLGRDGGHAEPLDRVAGILNPLWGSERVAGMLEFLYARAISELDEMAQQYAKAGCRNPWPAKVGTWEVIECGHNPHLVARRVEDLAVDVDAETGLERISWIVPARRNPLTTTSVGRTPAGVGAPFVLHEFGFPDPR